MEDLADTFTKTVSKALKFLDKGEALEVLADKGQDIEEQEALEVLA